MTFQDEVIVLTSSTSVADAVTKALEDNKDLVVAGCYQDLSDLVGRIRQRPVAAVIVDLDPNPLEMLDQLGPVIAKAAQTCFLVLSHEWDEQIVLEAMEIGARRFMRKESVPTGLAGVLRRLLPRISSDKRPEGVIVTVLSAGGGAGATTIAVNIANELRLIQQGASILLVDMDTSYGAVASFLNLSGTYGLANVTNQSGAVDIELVRSSATPCTGGLDVLLSPVAVDFINPPVVRYDNLGNILGTFKQAYSHIVIDAPRVRASTAAVLAQASKAVLIVMQLTVKDVRIGQQICSMLSQQDIPPERVMPVVSRYSKKDSSIGLVELKRAIGCNEIAVVGDDFPHAIRSIDMGEPLALTAARSQLRKDIQKLVGALVSMTS